MLRDDDADQIEADTDRRATVALVPLADAEKDTRQSVARITASPYLVHTDQVRGFVYDVRTGRLAEVLALTSA